MPMPHRTQLQVIRRRLQGKQGVARVRELRAVLADLPDYKNGPYADLRKWVQGQLVDAQQKSKAARRESLAVPREDAAAQVAVVGPPNAGKSSLLHALSDVQIATGDYAFTTTRPLPAVVRAGGVRIQLVEIPGLIEGARDDRGGGRALLGVVRNADAIVLCRPAGATVDVVARLEDDLRASGIALPTLVAVTRADELEADAVVPPGAVRVSILDDASLDAFRDALLALTGLVRVYLRKDGEVAAEPLALRPPVTVEGVAHAIHHELGDACRGALLWGPSARFDGQLVGRAHVLVDGDTVEIVRRRG